MPYEAAAGRETGPSQESLRPVDAGPDTEAFSGALDGAGIAANPEDLATRYFRLPGLLSAAEHTPTTEAGTIETTDVALPVETPSAIDTVNELFYRPEVGIAALRGELRQAQALVQDRPMYHHESPQYKECIAEYTGVKERHDAAMASLLGLLDTATVTEQTVPNTTYTSRTYHSWRYHEPVDPDGVPLPGVDGKPLRLAYEVTLVEQDGRLRSHEKSIPPVEVKTHVIHTPRHGMGGAERNLTGMMAYDAVYDADAVVSSMDNRDVMLGFDNTIVADIAHGLVVAARHTAVAPWVDEYLALPPLTGEPSIKYSFGLDGRGIKRLIIKAPADREAAHAALAGAFDESAVAGLNALLAQRMSALLNDLKSFNAAPRYAWLLKNAGKIQEAVRTAQRQAMSLELLAPFKARLQQEVVKVERIEALAAMLRATTDMNSSAPKQTA